MHIRFYDSDGTVVVGQVTSVAGLSLVCHIDRRPLGRMEARLVHSHEAESEEDFWKVYRRLGGQDVSFEPVEGDSDDDRSKSKSDGVDRENPEGQA